MLTACTAATSPNFYRVTELVPGISTRDDAIAKLGPPSGTSNIGNSTILQWGGNNSPVHLAISFGMDGRMKFKRRLTRKSLINFPGLRNRSTISGLTTACYTVLLIIRDRRGLSGVACIC